MKHWLQRALLVVPAVALLAFCSVSFAAGDQALNDQNSGAQNQDLNRDLNDGAAGEQQADRNAGSGDAETTASAGGSEIVGQDANRISTARPEDRRSMSTSRTDAADARGEKWWWRSSWNWGNDDNSGSSGGHGGGHGDDGNNGNNGGHGGHGGKGKGDDDMSPSNP